MLSVSPLGEKSARQAEGLAGHCRSVVLGAALRLGGRRLVVDDHRGWWRPDEVRASSIATVGHGGLLLSGLPDRSGSLTIFSNRTDVRQWFGTAGLSLACSYARARVP